MLQQQELFDLLICCGGSVTLNETVSGMLDSQKDIVIGFLATGMINYFSKDKEYSGKYRLLFGRNKSTF